MPIPGQFVHVGPHVAACASQGQPQTHLADERAAPTPFLRRAFSIGGMTLGPGGAEVDLAYRVVGSGTSWMSGLLREDVLDGVGPLGQGFMFPPPRTTAWLVAGGVGFPPLLWFAEELVRSGHRVVLFLGAGTRDLIALDITARGETVSAIELPEVALVLATEDGSIGLRGTVLDALEAHSRVWEPGVEAVAVYTCGPEAMMRGVADLCRARGLRCQACMERSMACGIGACQSCVVPVVDATDAQGWRYALCCGEGPVFDAEEVIWDR